LKVSIFAWRLLRDRLPTKTNLVTQGIITPESHFSIPDVVALNQLSTYSYLVARLVPFGR
jgi:hypothetical protein